MNLILLFIAALVLLISSFWVKHGGSYGELPRVIYMALSLAALIVLDLLLAILFCLAGLFKNDKYFNYALQFLISALIVLVIGFSTCLMLSRL